PATSRSPCQLPWTASPSHPSRSTPASCTRCSTVTTTANTPSSFPSRTRVCARSRSPLAEVAIMCRTLWLTSCLTSVALLLAGCAAAPIYPTPADTLQATPAMVSNAPENYLHQPVIWGGRIIKVTNLAHQTRIELLAYPLDKSQHPQADDSAQGRFIALVQ